MLVGNTVFWRNGIAAYELATDTFEAEYGAMIRFDTLEGERSEVIADTFQSFATAWWGVGEYTWSASYYLLYYEY